MIRIAISSSDGITVDQHFGKASCFYVYRLTDSGLEFLERRDVESYCTPENAEKYKLDDAFNTSRFDKVYSVIQDCRIVYTQQIGETPAGKLREKGVQIEIFTGAIRSIAGGMETCH